MHLMHCLISHMAFVCSHMAFALVCHLFLYAYVFICCDVLCSVAC